MKSEYGRTLLWNLASAGIKGKVGVTREWEAVDIARFVLFLGWWPGMCVS